MIDANDVLRLPHGVSVTRQGLRDEVLDNVHEINPTARMFLEAAARRSTMGAAVADISRACGADPEIVGLDCLVTATTLNRAYLLNVDRATWKARSDAVMRSPSLAIGLRRWPAITRRYGATGAGRALVAIVLAVATNSSCWATVAILVGLSMIIAPGGVAIAAVFAAGILAATAVHELGHALVLVWRHQPFFVASAGIRIVVVHGPPASALVSAAGPLAAVAAGIPVAALGLQLDSTILLAGALPFLGQVLWLAPVTHDGRSIVGALMEGRALMSQFLVKAAVSTVVAFVVLMVALTIVGAATFASPGSDMSVGIGPIPIFSSHSTSSATSFSTEWGVGVLALAAGLLNAGLSVWLSGRRSSDNSAGQGRA
jgi:hypothetical protein